MAAALNSIFAAVNANVAPGMAASSIYPTYATGGPARFIESGAARVVWVPTTEDYAPASGQGGDSTVDSAGRFILPSSSLPPIWTRVCNVDVYVWAESRDTCETMLTALLSAIHDTCCGSYGVSGGEWLEPDAETKSGEEYVLRLRFLVPVNRVAPSTTTALVTSEPLTPQITPILGS